MKITVETVVNAPVARAWSAYTTPDEITKWNFASDDWHCPRAAGDLRVGGHVLITHGGQGRQHGF